MNTKKRLERIEDRLHRVSVYIAMTEGNTEIISTIEDRINVITVHGTKTNILMDFGPVNVDIGPELARRLHADLERILR